MYIVRWLMGHPIVAIWVLLGTALLLAFNSGSDKDDIVGSTVTTQLEEVNVQEKSTAGDEIAASIAGVNGSSLVAPSDSDKSNTDEANNNIGAIKSSSAPIGTTLDRLEDVSAQTKISKNADNKESATTDLSQLAGDEMLLMAREAYWNNGLDEAAQIYMKLIEREPKVLEHKGELGNVYWRQGYPKKAAELYSEIAIPMIENGNSERVANMIGFIGLFYPDRAALIHQKMQSNLGAKKAKEADKLIGVGKNNGKE